eukprot:m.47371 g.47371  ORF g.47371 m.47371 type:complete len:94 (+) comp12321_c0_seq1:300-581(+)
MVSFHGTLFLSNSPDFYRGLDIQTLFFIFYNRPNTTHQYYAAQELVRAGWRYHEALQTWFQRQSQPTQKTSTFETGTYTYFDYKKDWCQVSAT